MKTKSDHFSPKAPLTPLNQALKYLTIRSRSIKEIQEYLKKKKYSEEDISTTIDKLKQLKFLNDDNFARTFAENRQRAGKSKRLIEMELKLKGVDKSTTQNILFEATEDYKTALEYITKRIHQFDRFEPQARKKKIISRLRSRGYNWEVISKILTKLQ